MKRIIGVGLLILFIALKSSAQTNAALNISELLTYNVRFKPYDTQGQEKLKQLKPEFLINYLKSDNEKNAFWINVYNSYMLTFLRDTIFEGVYTNFYKIKNVTIAGKAFSLFDIENEFLRLGIKNKTLGFKKSILKKDTLWVKLRPKEFDIRAIYLMYRGLYGYPPFQTVENANIAKAYLNSSVYFSETLGQHDKVYDWIKPYMQKNEKAKTNFCSTPFAVQIKNFYPKYEGIIYKEENKNPWLK